MVSRDPEIGDSVRIKATETDPAKLPDRLMEAEAISNMALPELTPLRVADLMLLMRQITEAADILRADTPVDTQPQ